jgi:hypothetical protein
VYANDCTVIEKKARRGRLGGLRQLLTIVA